MKSEAITQIPEGMIPHTDDSSKYGFPPGVERLTVVRVVIQYGDRLSMHEAIADCFGWSIKAATPCCPGLTPCEAPITHYQIMSQPPARLCEIDFHGRIAGALGVRYAITAKRIVSMGQTAEDTKAMARMALYVPWQDSPAYEGVTVTAVREITEGNQP